MGNKKNKSVWFDVDRTLSYNRYINMVTGPRGVGKTYNSLKRCIKNFVNKGEQFVYMRRYKTEMEGGKKEAIFNSIIANNEFPDLELTVKGWKMYCNKELMGFFIPLSCSQSFKSISYDLVTTIIYDEFIVDKAHIHYIKDEINVFFDVLETVFRMRENVRVLMLSNAISIYNPYFVHYGVKNLDTTKEFNKPAPDVLIQYVRNDGYIEKKKNSRLGRLIQGTDYAKYSIENQWLLDNDHFIEKKSDKAKNMYNITFKGKIFGIWIDYSEGRFYCSRKYNPNRNLNYALTTSDFKPNMFLVASAKKDNILKFFVENYQMGNVYFEDNNIKNTFIEIFQLLS